MKRFISMGQAASALGISTRTLRRKIALGLVPAPTRLGARCIRFSEAEFEAFLDSAR